MKHILSPSRWCAESPPQMGSSLPPTTPWTRKPKRKCRLIIHPPKQKPPTATYLRTPFNKSYRFPSIKKAKNDIRDFNEMEFVELGVTPLIHKCEDMGDLGLSGVWMEDDERGEKGEKEFGIGLRLEKEEDEGKRKKVIWLKEKLWGKGTWAVTGVREEEMEMERERLARREVPGFGDEDELEINGGPVMHRGVPSFKDFNKDEIDGGPLPKREFPRFAGIYDNAMMDG
ncbi:hypothetical protein BKA58DRAFT_444250 [Alternaria rosae]|uniref:uncharacterized protein n=1 Tax=Alternaria rosae TaxID=1187941 RepID=UPI001E8D6454|nr:uncharacterized protein BKA58DRAFT_444250 [Alternaria rosae]KAH6859077.1 hypothetical protein BKA58DRAFT_444250 [Alternaria rosae]